VFTLRFYHKAVEFKDGYCLCHGFGNHLGVIYRTDQEWELWEARRAEREELKDEQERERLAEAAMFKGQDDYLRQEIHERLSAGRYAETHALLDRRFALRNEITDERNHDASLWQLRWEAVEMFSKFPTADDGIEFLERHGRIAYDYMLLAKKYHFRNKTGGEKTWIEMEKIYRAASTKFADAGPLVKHICLFWERQSELRRAVEFCQLGIDRGLKDDTVSGFPGRMKRLKRKLGNLGP